MAIGKVAMVMRNFVLIFILFSAVSCESTNSIDYKNPEKFGSSSVILLKASPLGDKKAVVWHIPISDLATWCQERNLKMKTVELENIGSILNFANSDLGDEKVFREAVKDSSNMTEYRIINKATVYYFNEDTFSEYRIVYDQTSQIAYFWSSSN